MMMMLMMIIIMMMMMMIMMMMVMIVMMVIMMMMVMIVMMILIVMMVIMMMMVIDSDDDIDINKTNRTRGSSTTPRIPQIFTVRLWWWWWWWWFGGVMMIIIASFYTRFSHEAPNRLQHITITPVTHWIQLNAALTLHNFHFLGSGEHSLPGT